jgi:hypothetical protein
MATYNFFIEKSNYNTNEIMIRPDYPIECNDKERLSVKLVDFKHLNSSYNISDELHNNTFNVISYFPAYDINNIISVPATNYDIYPDYAIADNTFLNVAIREYDGGEERLIGLDYSVFYGSTNPSVPTIQKTNFRNTFNANFVPFDVSLNYITIHKKTTTTHLQAFILQKVYIAMAFINDNNPLSTNLTITFRVRGSMDNITYNVLTTTNNSILIEAGFINGNTIINVNNTTAYKYYKIEIQSRSTPYNVGILRLDQMFFYKANTTITPMPESTSYFPITISDGFYNIDTLLTTINATPNTKITFAKQEYTNKIIITNSVPLATIPTTEIRTLVFPNLCTANMYGFKVRLNPLNNAPIYSDTYVNIMNFSKIIISTDLAFSIKTHNDISNDASPYTKGIGNVLEWIDADDTPFTCIKYKNIENIVHKLDNRFISQFKLLFCTEKSLPIILDNFIIHLQIIKYKK